MKFLYGPVTSFEDVTRNFEQIQAHGLDDTSLLAGAIDVRQPPYNAPSNGSADATDQINKAIAALPAQGGKLIFPGQFVCSGPLNLDSKRAIILQGVGGISAGATPASQIIFNQSGSASALSCRSSFGITMRDLSVINTNGSFTGSLIDFSHNGGGGSDAAYMTLENMLLSGQPSCARLLDLHQAIIGSYKNVHFGGADRAVRGEAAVGGTYSNSHSFETCTFINQTSIPILSPGQAWSFTKACTWEAIASGAAGAIIWGAGTSPKGLVLEGGWFGDAVAGTGFWVDFETAGGGASIRGNYFGGGDAGVFLAVAGLSGIDITGNKMDGCVYGVNVAGAIGVNGLTVMNDDSTCSTSGVSLSAGSVTRGLIMDGKAGTVSKFGGY